MSEIKNDIEKLCEIIESQRRLFIETVKQFEKDLTYLRGTLANIWAEYDRHDSPKKRLEFSLRHIDDMQSMLNDFELRMSQNERN